MNASRNLEIIQGAGGEGKGGAVGRVAQESPDTLRSIQKVRVLDLISEGETKGPLDPAFPLKSLFLDGTPVQNDDGTLNFENVSYVTVPGTQGQTHIPGFNEAESAKVVNVEVKNSNSITRTITDANTDAVRITLSTPTLTEQNVSNGDLGGSTVQIAIDVQANGGGFVEKKVDTISGKTTTKYTIDYRILLTGSAPWDIRVRRITADSDKVAIQNKTFWDSYTELIDSKLTYPNSAIRALEVSAEQFSNVPTRGFLEQGLIIQVPVNYDPVARTYSGVWDGTFKAEYSNNPAWVWYDMVTNDRYGLGKFITADQVDKWELFAIGQYCDGMVPDGFGGTEPRFTCNVYLQTRQEAWRVIHDLASVFRAMPYWTGSSLSVFQDRPTDPVYLFNPSNVIDGEFTYSGTSIDDRHTVAVVTWNDPAANYEQKPEYVEDQEGIIRYGIRETPLIAVGATSRGQANRVGAWLLYSELEETQAVTFRSGLESKFAFPGAIIKVLDPKKSKKEFGGRIQSGTTTQITIDRPVTLEVGKTYTLWIVQPDGTTEEQPVSTAPGTVSVLDTTAFAAAPQQHAVWVLSANDLKPRDYKVISITEKDGIIREIVAREYDATKYALIEQGLKLEASQTTTLPVALTKPTNIVIGEYFANIQGVDKTVMTIALDAVPSATKYQFQYRLLNGNFLALPEVTQPYAEVPDAAPGNYQVEVIALNNQGLVSPRSDTATGTVLGRSGLPVMPQVSGLQLFGQGNNPEFVGKDAKFTWRISSQTSAFELGQEPFGGDSGTTDPFLKDYEVRILDESETLLRTEHVLDNSYTYSFEKNVEDSVPSGPRRKFIIEVYQRGQQGQISFFPARMTVNNPAPKLPANVNITAGVESIFIKYDPPVDHDWEGLIVWVFTSTGFPLNESTKGYKGRDSLVVIGDRNPDTDYFIRYAAYDAFGESEIIVSPFEALVKTGLIQTTQIADAAIDSAKIALLAVGEGQINNLAVGTLKIKDNAVTIPVSAYTAGGIGVSTTYTTVQSATIVSLGGDINILVSFNLLPNGSFPGLLGNYYFKIIRDSTEIVGESLFLNAYQPSPGSGPAYLGGVTTAFNIADHPGAGTYTYKLQIKNPTNTNVQRRSLILLETLK